MPGLTFTFHGPDGQHVAAVDGVVSVDVRDHWKAYLLEKAAASLQPQTPTGPWRLGGKGMEDAASVYWAARMVVPGWPRTGQTPRTPYMPPGEPGVVY